MLILPIDAASPPLVREKPLAIVASVLGRVVGFVDVVAAAIVAGTLGSETIAATAVVEADADC